MKPQSLLTRQLLQNADFSFDSMWKCPRYVRAASKCLEYEPDVLTPLKKGKKWLFEYTKQFQPKTAECLLNGEKLFVCGNMPAQIPLMSLYIEVNGFLLVIGVNSPRASPDNPQFNIKLNNRFQSLPADISKAYYHRFDGLGIERYPMPLGHGWFLPSATPAPWSAADGFLASYHLRKQ